jgi:transcriptional regulator ATRX
LEKNPLREEYGGRNLLPDYTFLRKIWTHPKVLENAWLNATQLKEKKDAKMRRTTTPDSDEDVPDDIYDTQQGNMSVRNDWWREYVQTEDLESLRPSNKLRVMFEILKYANKKGEKW